MRLIRSTVSDEIEFLYGVMVGAAIGFVASTVMFAIGWVLLS